VFKPLRALSETGGYVVLMGVGLEAMTLIHLAEQMAGRNRFRRWANGPDGRPMEVATRAIEDDASITHCGDAECGRCDDAVMGGPLIG